MYKTIAARQARGVFEALSRGLRCALSGRTAATFVVGAGF